MGLIGIIPGGANRDHDKPLEKGTPEWDMYFGENVMKRRKKKQSPSNALTDAVIKYIKANGGAARRVNSQGQWDESLGKFRPSGMLKGFEDIDAIKPIDVCGFKVGLKVAIEVKTGKDKLSEHQIKRKQEVEKCHAIYYECKDIDSFIKFWDAMISHKEILQWLIQ